MYTHIHINMHTYICTNKEEKDKTAVLYAVSLIIHSHQKPSPTKGFRKVKGVNVSMFSVALLPISKTQTTLIIVF